MGITNTEFDNGSITSQKWESETFTISHSVVDYKSLARRRTVNEGEWVRLHFGLSGNYDFSYKQLGASFSLCGHHNNIMYSDGLEIEVANKSHRIETFGINFTVPAFVHIAQNGNEALKRFADTILSGKSAILSPDWRPNSFRLQEVIQEIIHCPYNDQLKQLFLLSKSIEILVLQADVYESQQGTNFVRKQADKQKLFEAKEILDARLDSPPSLKQLSLLIGLNEYKLKKGFKEIFGVTVFGYIHSCRMSLAKKLLLGSDKSAKEIAYETGYSSPQHFSRAFKKEFGITPKRMRNHPDSAIHP